jgi:hypothetical protein
MAEDKIMTIAKLAKIVNQIVECGNGRQYVAVHKDTLDTGNNTFNVCEIYKAEMQRINICDGDGFTEENKDGSERSRLCLVLRGRWSDNADRQGLDLLERELERLEHEVKMTRQHIERVKAKKMPS